MSRRNDTSSLTHEINRRFSEAAAAVARTAGHPSVFIAAVATVIVWAAAGPTFRYSDTWQLIINTGTTIVTFLMVFLIQNSQNRDNAAIQLKLDELIRSGRAQNTFAGIEHLTDEELEDIRARCEARAKSGRGASRRGGENRHR
ncbi:MAG: low affinity iron permease family protein [Pseudolabrys sp.]|nr:low affinity iron permease family protein [Pseudolabrys sp.]